MGIKALNEHERRIAAKKEKEKTESKCNTCPFSTWTGISFYCPFPSCAKEIAN